MHHITVKIRTRHRAFSFVIVSDSDERTWRAIFDYIRHELTEEERKNFTVTLKKERV